MNRDINKYDKIVKEELTKNLQPISNPNFILRSRNLKLCDAELFEIEYPSSWHVVQDNIKHIKIYAEICNGIRNGRYMEDFTDVDISTIISGMSVIPVITIQQKKNDKNEVNIHVTDTIYRIPTNEFHDCIDKVNSDVRLIKRKNYTQKFSSHDINNNTLIYKQLDYNNQIQTMKEMRFNIYAGYRIYSIRYKSLLNDYSLYLKDVGEMIKSFTICR